MVAPDRLSALPGLYKQLMAQPRMPVVRGFLPETDALYVFYVQDEPVLTGAPPHLDEASLLYPSFRASISIQLVRAASLADSVFSNFRRRAVPFAPLARQPVEARWLRVENDDDRLMLEIFVSQKLGLSVSHPKVRDWLSGMQDHQMPGPAL
ncbi:hypothetical protein OB03_06365 [Brevundimonas sp. GN22]